MREKSKVIRILKNMISVTVILLIIIAPLIGLASMSAEESYFHPAMKASSVRSGPMKKSQNS